MIVLPDSEHRTIVCSFVWTKHRNVKYAQTDRQKWSGYSGLHCEVILRVSVTASP